MRCGRCGLGDDAKQSGMFTSDLLFGPQPPEELEILSADIKGGIALAVKLDMSCPVLLLRYHSWFDSTECAHRSSSQLRSSVSHGTSITRLPSVPTQLPLACISVALSETSGPRLPQFFSVSVTNAGSNTPLTSFVATAQTTMIFFGMQAQSSYFCSIFQVNSRDVRLDAMFCNLALFIVAKRALLFSTMRFASWLCHGC